VATAIVVVALLPSVVMIGQGTRSVDTTGRRILLGQLASLLLEDLKIRPPSTVTNRNWTPVLTDTTPDGPLNALINLGDDGSTTFGLGDPRFVSLHERLATVAYRVEVVDDTPVAGLRVVTVTMRDAGPRRTVEWPFAAVLSNGTVPP